MEIGFVNGDAENGARKLAELLQLLNQIGLGRKFADATDAKRLVDAGHEKDQLQLSAAAGDVLETVDAVVAGAIGHQQLLRRDHVDKTRRAASWRGVDAAVRA